MRAIRTYLLLNQFSLPLLLLALLLVQAVPALAQSRPAPLANARLAKNVRGEEAVQSLGTRLRDVAEFHRMKEDELRGLFQRDRSLWVDRDGRLFYVCEFTLPKEGPPGESTNTPPLNPLYSLDQTFKLHSRPGASRVIYLDFDGHDASTTIWVSTSGNVPMARPYDTDGNANTFSTAERSSIQYIWSRVAEDYMQYDIDVTTEDPGVAALINTGTGRYGVRVGIGGDSSDFYGSAGGVAYLNSFDNNEDLPCWVFPKSLGDSEKNIAEATSHEAGHTLGLNHDGRTSPVEEYYTGHGNWAPIMGVGYDKSIVQWSRGEYTNPSNTEDDLTRMLLFGAINRADDHGNNIGTASPLTGVRPSTWGIINSQTDLDFFSFEAGAGPVTITASPAPRGPNLHILLSLYNSSGGLITSAQVTDSASTGTLPVTIATSLAAGTYYVSVDGVGVGTASTGYNDYSSIGMFTLSMTLPGDSSWTATPGGTQVWTNTPNWSSSTVPFGLSAIARINNNISGDQNILIDTQVRIGGLVLGDTDATHSFTIESSGSGVLQLGATNGNAWITKTTGLNDIITAPLLLQSDLVVTNTTAADLVLAGAVDGAFTLNKAGSGRLVLAGTNNTAGLVIAAGTVALETTALIDSVATINVQTGAVFDVTAQTIWQLATNNLLSGSGVVTGDVATASSSQIAPGTTTTPGTLTFASQLTLNDGTALAFNLSSITNTGDSINDLIAVGGNLVLDGIVAVNFDFATALPETNSFYTILTYGGTLTGGATNFAAANAGNRFSYIFDDSVPGEIRVQISGAPVPLIWQGGALGNLWDVGAATNWLSGVAPDAFYQGDAVLFDPSGSTSPAVDLTGALSPSSVTVSNTSGYTFSGSGRLSGTTSLTKQGSSSLTVTTSNDFSGLILVEDGTLLINNASALGLTNSGTTVSNIGQLNLNGFALGTERISLSGNGPTADGALINTGSSQTNALRHLTLLGDTTIGGSTRWDIRGIPSANITANLIGNNFNLTKTGANEIWFANVGSTALGNIIVDQGTLGFEGANTNVNTTLPVTVNSGATLAFLNAFDSDFSKPLVLDSCSLRNDSGHNILTGTATLTGTIAASAGEAATLDLRGAVSGAGGFTKTGPGILRLAGANTFAGDILISAGTVFAGNNAALGNASGTTTISAGARLDVAAFNLGAEPISVTGAGINSRGAIVNSLPTAQAFALRFVTLTGDTTFGGNGRWDVRGNPTGSLLGAFNITKVGQNEIWFANLGATQLRTITINEGTLGIQGTTTLGNSANTMALTSGTTLAINGTGANVLSKTSVSLNTARIINTTGSNVFTTSLALTGSNQVDSATASTLAINGNITGAGFFNKTGAGALVVGGTTGSTGQNRVSAGTLQIGAGGLTGTLNGTLTNSGTLIFNRRNDLTHSGIIAGTGTVTKQNTNMLTLSAANTYSGATTVSTGTLRVGNAAALGTTTAGTTIASGGTLDVNGFSLGIEAITASGAGLDGAGAVVNTGASQNNALQFLTLAANATLGGSARWDLRSVGGAGALSSSGQSRSLTKTGPNTIALNNVTVDAALGNVVVQQGTLSVEQGTTGLGNPSFSAIVSNGATLQLYSLTNALNKVVVLENGGKLLYSGPVSGGVSSSVSGPVTLSGGDASVENSSTVYSLQLNNAVSGTGNFHKTGAGLVQLNGTNIHTGNTLIDSATLKLGATASLILTPNIAIANGAVLDVTALSGGFILGATQTLSGNGIILGNVTANGAVAPGTSVGQLTVSGNITLAGTTVMELTKAGLVLTNDVLSVSGALTSGGTLAVTHSGNPLVLNDSFRLFTAGAFTGSFITLTLPPLDAGLAWDTSTIATDGWLRVVNGTPPVIGSISLNGNEVIISGSGGTPGATYYVMATTNVALPLVFWSPLATNLFDAGGNFNFTNPVVPANAQEFFRLQVP